jgi:N-acyl-D-amino-acid deacylase
MRPIFAPTMKTDRNGKRAIYADSAFRAAFKEDTRPGQRQPLAGWAERAVISVAPGHADWEERGLAEVAAEQDKTPIDLALDLSLASDFKARFRVGLVNTDETEVAELLVDPYVVVALSDAGAHASQLCDACYATYLLGHWVRERKLLSLEQAVHMLTARAAAVFGITDRGLLAAGRPADVVVFDPATVAAGKIKRVWDLPSGADRLVAPAIGVDAVIVNGTLVRQNGADAIAAGPLPGRLLRAGRA